MMNPAAIMKLMSAKNKFEKAHPKFVAFFQAVLQRGVVEGTVIEVTVTHPDGTTLTSNMRVQASDLELVQELKELGTR